VQIVWFEGGDIFRVGFSVSHSSLHLLVTYWRYTSKRLMTLQYYTAQNSLMVVCLILEAFRSQYPVFNFTDHDYKLCRSRWSRCLRRGSAAASLLGLPFRISPGAWRFVSCDCRLLSERGLWDELIIRPEEFYRLQCVVVCDLETSRMRRQWPSRG
jgi:hypothetical protein